LQGCFYSNNNSAVLREVWKMLPYPEVDWGEDQLWADMVLKAGFQKGYVHDAVVYHSHANDDVTLLKKSISEGEFWARYFGLQLVQNEEASIRGANMRDQLFAKQNAIDESVTTARLHANEITARGRYRGWLNVRDMEHAVSY